MISPQASVHFLLMPRRSLNLAVDSSLFSTVSTLIPVHHQKRGTLEILPFSKDGVFDCIHKLCRHPVDPILRGFCGTQLKSLQMEEEMDQFMSRTSPILKEKRKVGNLVQDRTFTIM